MTHASRAPSPRTGQNRPRRRAVDRRDRPVDRDELGPAKELELVRALGMLELQRRRFVRDRTQAIQRLRSDWTQLDPVAEAATIRCDRKRELRKLKRIQLGDSPAQRTAARCIRELARDIDDLNQRIP